MWRATLIKVETTLINTNIATWHLLVDVAMISGSTYMASIPNC